MLRSNLEPPVTGTGTACVGVRFERGGHDCRSGIIRQPELSKTQSARAHGGTHGERVTFGLRCDPENLAASIRSESAHLGQRFSTPRF